MLDADDEDLPVLTSSSSYEKTSNIENIIEKIGCGRSQFFVVLIIIFVNTSYAYQCLIMYYMGHDPPWTCVKKNSSDFCMKHFGVQFASTDDDFGRRCSLTRSEWKYVRDSKYSLVTEYDLVCGKEYLNALANSAIFIGWGVGGIITAVLTDTYGRKKALVTSVVCVEAFAIGSSFVTDMWQLILVRVFIGVCAGTLCSAGYIYMCEFSSFKYRSTCINTIQTNFSITLILLSVLAMHVQEWRKLEVYAALPGIVAFFILFALPESPRWLHAVGKSQKADKILQKVIKLNRIFIAPYVLIPDDQYVCAKKKQYSYRDLFARCSVLPFILALAFSWFACGLVYYGVFLESSNLGGSIYVNFMLSSISDIVGSLSGIYLMDKGRRKVTVASVFTCGIAMAGIAAVPRSWSHGYIVRITLAMIGKMCAMLAFGGYYLWTTELYPTVIRTQGMMICQITSRIGSASSPFITSVLQTIYPPLPFIIMSCVSILAALVSLILPETVGKPICENIRDMFGCSPTANVLSVNADVEPLVAS